MSAKLSVSILALCLVSLVGLFAVSLSRGPESELVKISTDYTFYYRYVHFATHASAWPDTASIDTTRLRFLAKNLQSLEDSLRNTNRSLASVEDEVAAIRKLFRSQFDTTRGAISKIEGLILDEPERLIALPLLRRDIQALKDDLETTKEFIKDTYDLFQWLVGTLILGILALIIPYVNSFIESRKEAKSGKKEKRKKSSKK